MHTHHRVEMGKESLLTLAMASSRLLTLSDTIGSEERHHSKLQSFISKIEIGKQ